MWNYRRAELIKFGWAQINQVALVISGPFLVISDVPLGEFKMGFLLNIPNTRWLPPPVRIRRRRAAVVCWRRFSPLARSSCAPTNALMPCPDPPRPISATPDRSRPSAVPRNGAATEQNGKKRADGGRKRCCGRQPKGTSGRGDPWPGLCSRGQPRGASKAPLPARLACYSARASDPRGGGRGSRWGSCHRPGAAATARSARQDAQGGAVALGQG